MPLLNRVFKGQGERFLSSEAFWNSDLGGLCRISFDEVTADTFTHLVDATDQLRQRIAAGGGRVSYAAYGYHGTEVLIDGAYTWQSYTPYLQGWAKMRLEEAAAAAWERGVKATVFNSPEIQTNSSGLFLGEISHPPWRPDEGALRTELADECRRSLRGNPDGPLPVPTITWLPLMAGFRDFDRWPLHNTPEQAEYMLTRATELLGMNANPKEIVCAALSRGVFTGVGRLMFDSSWQPAAPVFWLNHDIVAKRLAAG
jgi:hypothetical protein